MVVIYIMVVLIEIMMSVLVTMITMVVVTTVVVMTMMAIDYNGDGKDNGNSGCLNYNIIMVVTIITMMISLFS